MFSHGYKAARVACKDNNGVSRTGLFWRGGKELRRSRRRALSQAAIPYLCLHSWSCHVDDDMYVRIPPLVELLAKFEAKKEAVYFGRSGSSWDSPRKVLPKAKLSAQGQGYHFAVGGMFCLSRAMLELARPYLV